MRLLKKSNFIRAMIFAIFLILVFPAFQSILFTGPAPSTAIGESIGNGNLPPQPNSNSRGNRATPDREIPDSDVMYAIIAPKLYVNTLIPLVNWKTYKGVPSKIFTIESIYANYSSGRDNAENIRNFLLDLEQTSSALEWLLIVGDADVVPTRLLYAGAEYIHGLNDNYTSDYYYAGLDGTWDTNDDGIYGDGTLDSSLEFEGDWDPELYVGRIPVNNVSDLIGSVDDILAYEQNPDIGFWMKRVVMWGALMDAPNVPAYKPWDTNAYKAKELYVKPILDSKAQNMNLITRYDYSQLPGGSYSSSTDKLYRYGAGGAVPDFNNGASLINFAGQAYYEGISLLQYDDPAGEKPTDGGGQGRLLDWQDVWDSTNGKKLPLVTAFTCGAGDFSEGEKAGDPSTYRDQSLERLLTAPNGGAIGFVGSTGKTYRGEFQGGTSDGNWWMDREFYEIFFDGTYQPGKCLYDMKWQYVEEMEHSSLPQKVFKAQLFGYNYLGDPELNIWTDEPGQLKVEMAGLWQGPHNMTATVKDMSNKPVPNARVCIQNNDIYAYGVTNSTGQARIFVNPINMNSVDVVVTAHNFLPFEDTFDLTIEPIDLKITTHDIEFSNANPMVNQQITINATITNRGETDLTSSAKVRFTRYNTKGSGTVIGQDQTITSLIKSSSTTVSVNWAVVPGEHIIEVEIDPENEVYESNKWNNVANKSIYIRRPELYISSSDIIITPDPELNDIYEGDVLDIKIKIYNNGEAPAFNVKLSLIDKSVSMVEKYISNNTVPVVNVAASISVPLTWVAQGGEHELIVKVDPDKKIPEFNETNNTGSKQVVIKYSPKIIPFNDYVLNEDVPQENVTNLRFYISDEDTSWANLNITIDSVDDNCSVVVNDYLYLDIFPASDWFGIANVTITVSDGIRAANDSFKVTVLSVPDPPRFNGTDFIIYATEDEELSYFVDAYDPDLYPITYSDDSELFDINPTTGEIRFTPTQDHVNNSPYNFNITLLDHDDVDSTTQKFELIVQDTPDPPIIHTIPKQYAKVNETFKLTIKAVDLDSDRLYFYDDTTLFVIDINTGKIIFTPNSADVGEHLIKIIVSDDDYQSANITFNLQINASDYVPPDPVDNGSSNGSGDELDLMVVAGVIIIIIVIIVLLMVMLLMRKRKKQIPTDQFYDPDYKDDILSHHDDTEEPVTDTEDLLPDTTKAISPKKDIRKSTPPKKMKSRTPPHNEPKKLK